MITELAFDINRVTFCLAPDDLMKLDIVPEQKLEPVSHRADQQPALTYLAGLGRYSNPDEIVFDPFAGLFTVPYMAVKLGRRGWGNELNPLYWENGVKYCRDAEMQRSMPSLFDDVVTADAYELEAVA